MATRAEAKILELIRMGGVVRSRELATHGIPRSALTRMCRAERLTRVSRGLYSVSAAEVTEYHSLVQVGKRFPNGVVCLLSALQFHELTTQLPPQVWLAIPRTARMPRECGLPIRIVRFSGLAYSEGIDEHRLEGVSVKIYNAAKTVADCFKFRNKIGIDVAIEALRDCLRRRKATVDELWRYAAICRVAKVMSPYLEALL